MLNFGIKYQKKNASHRRNTTKIRAKQQQEI